MKTSSLSLARPDFKRLPFFYGWLMLPIAMLAAIATSPGQTFGVSVFNPSFRAALSLSHSQLTGAYMIGTLLAALPQPSIGALMDRHGIRRTMTLVVILFGLACLFVSQVNSLLMLFFAFLFLRMFGQGALSLLANNTLAMWFHTRLGTVSGLMSVGMAGAVAFIPTLILKLINAVGWRWAYAALGLTVWAIMLPLLLFFFRNRPEEIGQHPDGLAQPLDERLPTPGSTGQNGRITLTLPNAMRTRAYWIILTLASAWAMIGTAITFNIIPLFESRGLTQQNATATFTTLAIAMAVMQIGGGILADRTRLNLLACLSAAGLTAGVLCLTYAQTPLLAHAYALTFGAAQGMLGAVQSTLWVRYYGRLHLGKIRGSTWTATVAGSSLGPFIMGFIFDQTGSYNLALWIFIALLTPLIIAALFATPPVRTRAS